jgi:hypothetical protein
MFDIGHLVQEAPPLFKGCGLHQHYPTPCAVVARNASNRPPSTRKWTSTIRRRQILPTAATTTSRIHPQAVTMPHTHHRHHNAPNHARELADKITKCRGGWPIVRWACMREDDENKSPHQHHTRFVKPPDVTNSICPPSRSAPHYLVAIVFYLPSPPR